MPGPDGGWLRLKDVFEGARALPIGSRPAYLDAACRDQPELRLEVEQLLGSQERTMAFLERPAALGNPPLVTATAPRIPARIGRYRVTAILGEGGMGVEPANPFGWASKYWMPWRCSIAAASHIGTSNRRTSF